MSALAFEKEDGLESNTAAAAAAAAAADNVSRVRSSSVGKSRAASGAAPAFSAGMAASILRPSGAAYSYSASSQMTGWPQSGAGLGEPGPGAVYTSQQPAAVLRCVLFALSCSPSTVRPQLFALNCSPSTVRPQLFALNCSPSTVRPQLFALN